MWCHLAACINKRGIHRAIFFIRAWCLLWNIKLCFVKIEFKSYFIKVPRYMFVSTKTKGKVFLKQLKRTFMKNIGTTVWTCSIFLLMHHDLFLMWSLHSFYNYILIPLLNSLQPLVMNVVCLNVTLVVIDQFIKDIYPSNQDSIRQTCRDARLDENAMGKTHKWLWSKQPVFPIYPNCPATPHHILGF